MHYGHGLQKPDSVGNYIRTVTFAAMNWIIRPAQPIERRSLARLSHLAFAPAQPFADIEARYESDATIIARSVVACEADRLLGKYALLPYRNYVAGCEMSLGGLGGVAVAPEGRGRGVASALMRHALEVLAEHRYPLSMLYPYRHGFYRRFGWACVGEVYRYRAASEDLPRYPEARNVLPLDPATDRAAVEDLYGREAPRHSGWLVREPEHWQGHFKPDSTLQMFGCRFSGDLEGYVICRYVNVSPNSAEVAHIAVREWVAASARAYRGLLGFLAAQRDQVDAVVWDTDRADPLPRLLTEQRAAGDRSIRTFLNAVGFGAIHSSFMWRLVDLDRALTLRPVRPAGDVAFNFEVHDPIFGTTLRPVEIEGGRLHLADKPAATTLKLDIDTLTQLWSGYGNARAAHWAGQLQVEGNEAVLEVLDRAWQVEPPFCWDFF